MKAQNYHRTTIYNNGKMLILEIEEYKTLFKAYVVDITRYYSHVSTLRVNKYKGMNYVKAVDEFRTMCINNRYF